MTAYREIELRCDGGSGPYDCEPALYAGTATKARQEARERGWQTGAPGGKDYCAKHRPSASEVSGV